MAELLTFGQHKLCNAELKDGTRIKTLMHILQVKSLLQETAVEAKRDYPKADYPTEHMALNRTLENVSGEVSAEVKFVEKMMDAIAMRKDKNENVASQMSERIQSLITMLTMETQECRANGMFEKPDPAPTGGLWGMMGMAEAGQKPEQAEPSAAQTGQEPQKDTAEPPAAMAQADNDAMAHADPADDQMGLTDEQTSTKSQGNQAGQADEQRHGTQQEDGGEADE